MYVRNDEMYKTETWKHATAGGKSLKKIGWSQAVRVPPDVH